ncbi:shikimate dehydrogenase [Nocardioides zeae]|uniref:Shikimate dehydrogenase n=1 Tax=Nocardioides imazamoxiresistens TaxID=3231893 RepID=A0ABU3PZK4_9ACTN|nr:shikimate dehydrogenase [Nocardioides zeae]MDT9594616.1 shikimate dehydrogenase [Nocardioides zeae]
MTDSEPTGGPATPLVRCGVVGDPVAHSLSPVLHRAAYAHVGATASTYDAHRVPAGTLAEFVRGLDGWRGLSVTMPLKREALALGTVVTPVARAAGGANTLVLGADQVVADNTDVPGAVAALVERGLEGVDTATILGGGATAASTALALAQLGARRLRLLVRSADRAAGAVEAVRSLPEAPEVVVTTLDEAVGSGFATGEVAVSTVPVEAQTPDLVERLAGAPWVFEVVYDPWPTPLALAAEAAGSAVVNGLDLLAHQAVLQVEAFLGARVPVDVLRDAGLAELAARAERAGA